MTASVMPLVWNDGERDVLRQSWGAMTMRQIARAVRRSRGAIIEEARRLGLPDIELLPPLKSKPWSDEETATVRECRAQGMTALQIAEHLPGRSMESVVGKMDRMDLFNRIGKRGALWSQDEMNLLRECREKGLERSEIMLFFPERSSDAIATKIRENSIPLGVRDWEATPSQLMASAPPGSADPEAPPRWTPPPKDIVFPAPVVLPARTCQFPLWPNRIKTPVVPEFCGKPSFVKHANDDVKQYSFCHEHWMLCYRASAHDDR